MKKHSSKLSWDRAPLDQGAPDAPAGTQQGADGNGPASPGRTVGEDGGEPRGFSWGPGRNFQGWSLTLLVLGILAAAVFAGMKLLPQALNSTGADKQGPPGNMADQMSKLAADLCRAESLASGRPEQATTIFEAEIHGPLHVLAEQAIRADRPAAAKLLEDKARVETVIRQKLPPPVLAESLGALSDSSLTALRAISLPSPPCP